MGPCTRPHKYDPETARATKVNAETKVESKRCLGIIAGFGTCSSIYFVALGTNIRFIHLACINQQVN
jgi:hypothetical protein